MSEPKAHTMQAFAFSPDSKQVVTTAHTGEGSWLRVWSVATEQPVYSEEVELGAVTWSPCGKRVLAVPRRSEDSFCVWDTQTWRKTTIPRAGGDGGKAVYSPDGLRLAVAGKGRIVDAATGKELVRLQVPALHGRIFSIWDVVWSQDGKQLATAGEDGRIALWDAHTGAELRAFQSPKAEFMSVALSPDGQWLASGDRNGVVRVWSLTTGREALTLAGQGGVVRVCFSPNSRRLATSNTHEGLVRLWDVESGLEVLALNNPYITDMAFSPDGQWFGATSLRRLNLWEGRLEK